MNLSYEEQTKHGGEATIRNKVALYRAKLEAHKTTLGQAAPSENEFLQTLSKIPEVEWVFEANPEIEIQAQHKLETQKRVDAQSSPSPDYASYRQEEYEKRGLTMERLTIALFENDLLEKERIQSQRMRVKALYPKPPAN